MQSLKSEQRQIPNGFWFRQPEINWNSKKVIGLHPSLDTLTQAVISARRANPHQAAQHNWSLDFDVVKSEVKQFNVNHCLAMGWTEYLTDSGGGAPPFNQAQSLLNQKQISVAVETVKRLWAGIKSVNEWLDSNDAPVSTELAEKRATTCVSCPLNGPGDFSKWFTTPASAAIKRQLEKLQNRKISTTQDEKLNICEACLCPLKLIVHVPLQIKLAHMTPDTKQALHPSCWVLSEEKATQGV
jgi:hypothetical protein